eukprot:3142758-Rhodomonas_salina.2
MKTVARSAEGESTGVGEDSSRCSGPPCRAQATDGGRWRPQTGAPGSSITHVTTGHHTTVVEDKRVEDTQFSRALQ